MNEKAIPKISTGQLFALLFVAKIALTVMYSSVSGTAHLWDMFLPLLIAAVLVAVLCLPVTFLYRDQNPQSICEIAETVFGRCGKIISVLYGLYFAFSFLQTGFVFRYFLNFILGDPVQSGLIIAAFTAAAVYAAAKGTEALSRMSGIVIVMFLLCSVLVFLFLIPDYSSENLLPYQLIRSGLVWDGVIFFLSRMNVLAAVNVYAENTNGKIGRSLYLWIFFLFLFTAAMLLLACGTVGEYIDTREFQAYALTDGSGSTQRLNPLFLLVLGCCVFCGFSLYVLAFAKCVKKIFSLNSHRLPAVSGGIVMLVLLLWLPGVQGVSEIMLNRNWSAAAAVLLIFVIPLLVLTAGKIKSSLSFRKNIKKLSCLCLVLCLLTVPMMSGCTGTQLNQRLIIQGLGIDRYEDRYKLTMIVLDTDDTEHRNASEILYAEGEDPEIALKNLENERGQKILLSQCLFMMMNEAAVRSCDDILPYFAQQNDMQKTVSLMVSDDSACRTVCSAVNEFHYTSEYINVLSDSQAVSQPSVHCTLIDYMSSLQNQYAAVLFPYIRIHSGTRSIHSDESYLFDRNGSDQTMNRDETAGTLIVSRKALNYTDTLSYNGKTINYGIDHTAANIVPVISGNQLSIALNIHIFTDKDYGQTITDKIRENVESKVNAGIDKTIRRDGCDVFSVLKYVRCAYPDVYRKTDDWRSILQQSDIRINVSCKGV